MFIAAVAPASVRVFLSLKLTSTSTRSPAMGFPPIGKFRCARSASCRRGVLPDLPGPTRNENLGNPSRRGAGRQGGTPGHASTLNVNDGSSCLLTQGRQAALVGVVQAEADVAALMKAKSQHLAAVVHQIGAD